MKAQKKICSFQVRKSTLTFANSLERPTELTETNYTYSCCRERMPNISQKKRHSAEFGRDPNMKPSLFSGPVSLLYWSVTICM